jgi:proteasome lid subunit RPN8/RPN11
VTALDTRAIDTRAIDTRAIDTRDLPAATAPATQHGFRVFLSEPAFDRATARGDGEPTREIGGVLVGELLRDAAGPFLRIDDTIDALHAEEKGAELTFTHATWDHIHKEMDAKHPDKRVVGWYHTHPGFGIFLSDRDQFIHKSFFNLPFQVAFVYDPKSREHGVFTWHDNEVWRARRYWVGPREQTWDGARARAPIGAGIEPTAEPTARPPGEPPATIGAGAYLPLGVIGVVVLAVGVVVGHWFAAGAAGQAVVESQVEVQRAKIEGAQATMALIQNQLIGILRDTLGDEALRAPVVQATQAIDQALAALPAEPTPPADDSPAHRLHAARDALAQLLDTRSSARAVLGQLEAASRGGAELRADLGHDVAEQRAGLGAVYAELAADAIKAKDLDRARRLLATAAHLDPGNRARYERQLQAFDGAASLPRESSQGSQR